MKYGIYFAYWEQEWEVDYKPYCQKIADLGFDVLEINGHGIAKFDDRQIQELKQAAKDAGIELSCGLGLTPEYNVSSSDEAVRKAGIEYMKKIFVNMEKLGIDRICGIIYAYWPVDYSKPVDKAADRANSIESVREMADAAKEHGVTLMLEVVNRFEQYILNDAAEARAFVKEVGKDNVKIHLDSFHGNIEEDNIADSIRTAGAYLGHYHVGESNRKVPGKGHLPWAEIGQALRDVHFDGYVVFEPFVRVGGGVGADIKVWRDLSNQATDAQLDRELADSLVYLKEQFEG